MISADQALARLRAGNHDFITVRQHDRDLSLERIEELYAYGQTPFAVVVTCSDSRTVPEHMFMLGLGDIFTVRVAGNVVGPVELASVVYACEHLGVKLVLVLGHTHCGAIISAMEVADGVAHSDEETEGLHDPMGKDDPLMALVDPICNAIGDEREPYRASVLNVRAGMDALAACPQIAHLMEADPDNPLRIAGAVYHTHSGKVDFLDEAPSL